MEIKTLKKCKQCKKYDGIYNTSFVRCVVEIENGKKLIGLVKIMPRLKDAVPVVNCRR